jgi:hypothetical protein
MQTEETIMTTKPQQPQHTIIPQAGEGFTIIIGRPYEHSKPEQLVVIDGRQYDVFGVHDALSELPEVDGKWVFNFDQEDALTDRLAELRTLGNQDLKQRIRELGVKGLAVGQASEVS